MVCDANIPAVKKAETKEKRQGMGVEGGGVGGLEEEKEGEEDAGADACNTSGPVNALQ